jgi:hypothetical protein
MAEITSITSEALQASIRRLLPSQQGFGEDLQASNVVVPTIDLTPTAEGSQLPGYLQRAFTFTDVTTATHIGASTTVLANSPGFWQLVSVHRSYSTASTKIQMSNGLSTKDLFVSDQEQAVSSTSMVKFDTIICLSAGESFSLITEAFTFAQAAVRQVADINGNLINPTGYTPQ